MLVGYQEEHPACKKMSDEQWRHQTWAIGWDYPALNMMLSPPQNLDTPFKVFPLCCTFRTRKVAIQIFINVRCPILRIKINTPQCWCCLATDMEEKQTKFETENK